MNIHDPKLRMTFAFFEVTILASTESSVTSTWGYGSLLALLWTFMNPKWSISELCACVPQCVYVFVLDLTQSSGRCCLDSSQGWQDNFLRSSAPSLSWVFQLKQSTDGEDDHYSVVKGFLWTYLCIYSVYIYTHSVYIIVYIYTHTSPTTSIIQYFSHLMRIHTNLSEGFGGWHISPVLRMTGFFAFLKACTNVQRSVQWHDSVLRQEDTRSPVCVVPLNITTRLNTLEPIP